MTITISQSIKSGYIYAWFDDVPKRISAEKLRELELKAKCVDCLHTSNNHHYKTLTI